MIETNIYVVIIDDTYDGLHSRAFANYEDAVTHFNEVKSSYLNDIIGPYNIDDEENYFCMYEDGKYLSDHITIMINKLILE